MEVACNRFKEIANKKLKDLKLRNNLDRSLNRFQVNRAKGLASLPNYPVLRDKATKIKEECLKNLPQLLNELEEKLYKKGVHVLRAKDKKDVWEYLSRLIKKHSPRIIVKSKSMTTEELAINDLLTEMDIEVFETDLGEFIVQLAEEPPSHILGPAFHKSKEEVAKLFSDKLKVPLRETPEELASEARIFLREKFIKADFGITGANFAISETGSILIVENEGNARLSTTIPKVVVSIIGIEKVIHDWDQLGILLPLLTRNATGQFLSSYVSIINGPRDKKELDGPEEFHVILLDNGRLSILKDKEFYSVLSCIRCAACLNVCPIYKNVGGHAYGWVYSGPIGAIINPLLLGIKNARELPFACTLCGACSEVCPVKIEHPVIIRRLRKRLKDIKEVPLWEEAVVKTFSLFAANSYLFNTITRTMGSFSKVLQPIKEKDKK